jgi:hypothetical protein
METLGHGNAHAPFVIIASHEYSSGHINVTISPLGIMILKPIMGRRITPLVGMLLELGQY